MSDMDVVDILAPVRAYGKRTAAGNAQDFEDACQLGSLVALKAQRAFDATLGDWSQYLFTRLAEELEIGRKADTQPKVFSDLPPAPPEEDDYIPGDEFASGPVDDLPSEDEDLEQQAQDLAAYEEVLAIKRLPETDPLKILWRNFTFQTISTMGQDLPVLTPALGRLVDHLKTIAALPHDAPVRRMFVWLGLLDVQPIPGLECEPTWTLLPPERQRPVLVTRQTAGVAVAPDSMAGQDVGPHPHPEGLLGQPFALYADDFIPQGVSEDLRGRPPSWQDDSRRGPESSTEIELPANGRYAADYQLRRKGQRYRLNVQLGDDDPEPQRPQFRSYRAYRRAHEAWVARLSEDDRDLREAWKLGYRNLEQMLDAELPESWALPTDWEAERELRQWLGSRPKPSKYSRNSRTAFCLAMYDGLGLKAANRLAWQAHQRTVVGVRHGCVQFGNGKLVPFHKISEPWTLALDVSREQACALIRQDRSKAAQLFVERLERVRNQ
jgi:hypothetical protein